MKKYLTILFILSIAAACSDDSLETTAPGDTVELDLQHESITVSVSGLPTERIDKTDDFSPTELRTTRLREDRMITTFDIYLGKFSDNENYDMELTFLRTGEEGMLATGTYPLVAFTDGVKVQPQSELYFESLNTFNEEFNANVILSGLEEDFANDFYAPYAESNQLVISSVQDLGKGTDDTSIVSEDFQRVKGYLVFNMTRIASTENITIRVDFDIINEIRIIQD